MKKRKFRVVYTNERNEKIIMVDNVKVAKTFFSRFLGLMGRKLKPNQGLLLYPCRSVHTFFMRQPINVIYLDRDWNIVKAVKSMKPWSVDGGHKDAYYTLELPASNVRLDKGKIQLVRDVDLSCQQ
jgi:uncharacterized membrane protein (UPF0127 family)